MDGPTLVDIVERELVSRHIKKAEFYAATKISSATFSQWRNNIYFPSAANIKKVVRTFRAPPFVVSMITKKRPRKEPEKGLCRVSSLCVFDTVRDFAVCQASPRLHVLR